MRAVEFKSSRVSMASCIFPSALAPGSTFGIVAPARWPEPEWITAIQSFLKDRGYHVFVHPQTALRDGQLAGDDDARAGGLMDMFTSPAIAAILCARGGANAIRIVDKLDYGWIADHPKPLIGFSDVSLLLNAITARTGVVTYHGPMAWNFAHEHDPRTAVDFFDMLQSRAAHQVKHYPKVHVVQHGSVEGRLVGGNLTRLELLMGTPYDWSARDGILFIEEVDEVLYKLDEKLRHLRLAGRFRGVRAVIVGEMIDIGDGETGFARAGEKPFGRTLREIFLDNLPPDIPLCFDFPCGHGKYLTTLPIGAPVQATFDGSGVTLRFSRG